MIRQYHRNLSFDFLRVLAVFYIIFVWHIQNYAGDIFDSNLTETLKYSALSIIVFISGFVLTRKYDHFYTAKEAITFFKRRFLRVYPLYLSALILFLMTSQVSDSQFISGALMLTMIQGIKLKTLWFVSMIFVFYIMLAVILHEYSLKRLLIVSSVFLFCCISLDTAFDMINLRLVFYYLSFVFGIVCAKHNSIFKYVKNRAVAVASLLVVIGFNYLLDFMDQDWFKYSDDIAFILFSIPPLVVLSDALSSKLNRHIVFKLSYASYCMYLYHRIVYWGLLEIYQPTTNAFTIAYLFLVGFPVLFLISYFIQDCYYYFLRKRKPDRFGTLFQRVPILDLPEDSK